MGKVLVKSYEFQIGPDGKPQMYYNITGRGRFNRGNASAGRTFRDRAGSFAGGTAGLLASLAGESRSFGGALGQAIAGAQQGSYFGRGLARRTPGNRRAQARADLIEGEKQTRARSDAEAQLAGEREMQRRRGLDPADFSLEQIRGMPSPNRRRILPGIGRKNMTQFGRDLAAYQTEQEAIAAEQAKREQKERTALERAGLGSDIRQLQQIRQMNNPELLDAANRLASGQVSGPTLGEMAQQPQASQQVPPLSEQTQGEINRGDQIPAADAQYADSSPSQRSTNIELPDDGGDDEGVDSAMLDRLRAMMEGENE